MSTNYYEEVADMLCSSQVGRYTSRETILQALHAKFPDQTTLREMIDDMRGGVQKLMDEAASRGEAIALLYPPAPGEHIGTLILPEG